MKVRRQMFLADTYFNSLEDELERERELGAQMENIAVQRSNIGGAKDAARLQTGMSLLSGAFTAGAL